MSTSKLMNKVEAIGVMLIGQKVESLAKKTINFIWYERGTFWGSKTKGGKAEYANINAWSENDTFKLVEDELETYNFQDFEFFLSAGGDVSPTVAGGTANARYRNSDNYRQINVE